MGIIAYGFTYSIFFGFTFAVVVGDPDQPKSLASQRTVARAAGAVLLAYWLSVAYLASYACLHIGV